MRRSEAPAALLEAVPEEWRGLLSEPAKHALEKLEGYLTHQAKQGAKIYPSRENWFQALKLVSPLRVRCCILGQDPYHGEGQAHGLAFSVPEAVKAPPSLRNILKELKTDALQHPDLVKVPLLAETSPDLTRWATQGVLLLNSVLTVEADQPGSHRNKGWELVTNSVIEGLSKTHPGLVFVLWGQYAQEKRELIDATKHKILESPHPSPLSARRGFFGSQPFSAINQWLIERGSLPIRW